MKSLLKGKNTIKIYSTHNKQKGVVAKQLTRILKNKIHKFMNAKSKNVYANKLTESVRGCNNTIPI